MSKGKHASEHYSIIQQLSLNIWAAMVIILRNTRAKCDFFILIIVITLWVLLSIDDCQRQGCLNWNCGILWNIKNHVWVFLPHHRVAITLLSSDGRHRQGWARQKVLASHQIWTWGSLPYIHCSLHYHCLCVHSHHEHHCNGSFSSIS